MTEYKYETTVVGSGPAGMNAVMYYSRTGNPICWITGTNLGGKPNETEYVENYLGVNKIEGKYLAREMYKQALESTNYSQDKLVLTNNVEEISLSERDDYKFMILIQASDDIIFTNNLIIGTGMNAKKLGLDNEEKLSDVHTCTLCDANFYYGANVIVVGGSYGAVESALYLSKICNDVTLMYRGDKLRADKVLIDRLEATDNIEVMYETIITKYITEPHEIFPDKQLLLGVEYTTVEDDINGRIEEKYEKFIQGVFINAGSTHNIGFIDRKILEDNPKELILCGDLVNPIKQISTAVVSGMEAAFKVLEMINQKGL